MHEAEALRDIPRTCTCTWKWDGTARAWTVREHDDGCPWHTAKGQ